MKLKVLRLDDHYVDKAGTIMPTDAKVEFPELVPLFLDFTGMPIGTAKMTREGNDFYIDDLIVVESVSLDLMTPAIGAKIISKHIEDYEVLDAFKIEQVSFQLGPNCDEAIKSVKEQLNTIVQGEKYE